jgi:hypothetical protein
LFYLVVLVLALIDIINTDDVLVRGMPKLAWVFLVVFVPLIGALLWLALGRPAAGDLPRGTSSGAASAFPEYDRPGRHIPDDPEADREFLQRLRDRAEQQRQTAREQRRAAESRRDEPDSEPPVGA